MNNDNSNNPQEHLSMLARTLLETYQGDENRVIRTMQRLSRCRNIKTVRHILSYSGVYPGETENITNRSLEVIFTHFQNNQEDMCLIDADIENAVEIESLNFLENERGDLENETPVHITS